MRGTGYASALPEIHHFIFDHCSCNGLFIIVSQGVMSRYFREMAKRYIVKDYINCLDDWAEKRLINFGDYMDHSDYPRGLFETDEEKQDLLFKKVHRTGDEAEWDEEEWGEHDDDDERTYI
jgi:hypothetical protein